MAMDMAVARYTELYGEAPEAEIRGKLAMVSDLQPDDAALAALAGSDPRLRGSDGRPLPTLRPGAAR